MEERPMSHGWHFCLNNSPKNFCEFLINLIDILSIRQKSHQQMFLRQVTVYFGLWMRVLFYMPFVIFTILFEKLSESIMQCNFIF